MAKGIRSRTGYSMRIGAGIGGNNDAGGGVFKDLPISSFGNAEAQGYFNDFISPADDDGVAAINIGVGGATGILLERSCGVYSITSSVNDVGNTVRMTNAAGTAGGILRPLANIGLDDHGQIVKRIAACEMLAWCDHWTDADWFLGVAQQLGATMTAAGVFTPASVADHVVFHATVADAGKPILRVRSEGNAELTPTYSGPTLADNHWYRFGLHFLGNNQVELYVNGILVGSQTLPGVEAWGFGDSVGMVPHMSFIGEGTAGARLLVDYIAVAQTRQLVDQTALL